MQPTWILVADRARARLLSPNATTDHLIELEDFANPDGRKLPRVINGDRPRSMESIGGARHVIEPQTSPEQKVAQRFASELAGMLERGRQMHRYERLILVAPPHFLGVLKGALNPHVSACVSAHLDRELTTLPLSELSQHLASLLKAR
jgi:protein required for attachment to host cells